MLLWKELNLLDTPPRSNRSALIFLLNRLSDSTLNSINVFKALDFPCTSYTYPNLEYSSMKVIKYPYPPMYEQYVYSIGYLIPP